MRDVVDVVSPSCFTIAGLNDSTTPGLFGLTMDAGCEQRVRGLRAQGFRVEPMVACGGKNCTIDVLRLGRPPTVPRELLCRAVQLQTSHPLLRVTAHRVVCTLSLPALRGAFEFSGGPRKCLNAPGVCMHLRATQQFQRMRVLAAHPGTWFPP